jgi:DNA invertase Pin-like site-specific DNA recombinase
MLCPRLPSSPGRVALYICNLALPPYNSFLYQFTRIAAREWPAIHMITVFRGCYGLDRSPRRRLANSESQLEAGDVVTVTRLDRLARSTRDLLNTLTTITGRKAGFRSLGDTWADTTTSHGRLMLTVLGGLAEFERDLIRARTGEGRERAKARGVKMGRPHKLTPHQQKEAIKRLRAHAGCRSIGRGFCD